MSRPVVRLLLGILAALVLGAIAVGGFCWWKMSQLKEEVVRGLEKSIGAQVQVASLDFDLWRGELHAAGISLVNERPSAPWSKGAISQATVRFHLTDILSSTISLSVDVSAWSVTLTPSSAAADSASASASGSSEPGAEPASPKSHVRVTELSAHEGAVEIDLADGKQITFQGVGFVASGTDAGIWTTDLQASSIKAGSLEAGASSVQIRSEKEKINFSNLRLSCGQGFITGEGEVDLDGAHEIHATLKATEVPVAMLVAVEWQMKLSGLVTGDLTYAGDDQGGSAKGQFSLNHAKFNVLPWLGKVTAMVGLADITDVEVDKATTDFEWKDRVLHLTNVDVRKNDVIRIAGTVDVDSSSRIDGKLKLGLPSSVTGKWPQLQEKVFSEQLEDYNWTDVHLTGTPDQLQEDLSSRLLAVGVQQGNSVLNQAAEKASDLWKSIMGK